MAKEQPKRVSTTRKSANTARKKRRKETRTRRIALLRRGLYVLIAAALVAATVFFLILRRGDSISISENAIGSLFSPVQNAFTTSIDAVRGFISRFRGYDDLVAQNEDLTYELQRAQLQLANAEQALTENERLKDLLDAADRYEELDPVYAKVIARDPGRWFDTFSVNRGSTNGITVGMAVCTGDGLVGRVFEVGLNYAKVLTIIDPRSAVACLVSRTRDNGVMRGQVADSSETPDCYVYYLPNISNVVPGDEVITSGTDSMYPKGISIGEVTQVSRESGSEGNYVIVTPHVDFQHIEEVLILREVIETDQESLSAVPTPTPQPMVTASPTPGAANQDASGQTDTGEQNDEWQYPTATPETTAAPNASAGPLRYENLPEDSWAES